VSQQSARGATQLLQLTPYKTIVIHALQLHDPANRVHSCSWFLQCITEDEIDLQLTFFSDEAWFGLLGYINTKNNCYWSSQNPHLTHSLAASSECWGLACCKGKEDCRTCFFFNGTINCERYAQVILWQLLPELTEEERLYGWFQQDSATAHTAYMSMQALSDTFRDRNISTGIWQAHSHNLNPCPPQDNV
jgi:hypothetical protein